MIPVESVRRRGAGGGEFLHRGVAKVCNEDVAGGVGRHAVGLADPARQRPQEHAGAGEFLHRVVAFVRDEDVAGRVGRHA